MFTRIKEFRQKDNDVYFFQIVSDKIIINDNYIGILILDSNLDLIKSLTIFDGITVYSSYVNNYNEELLLFCPDNDCIVHVNLKNYEYKVIHLKNGLESLIFSTLYEWNDKSLVLTTFKGEFYSICVDKKSIQKIDHDEVVIKYNDLHKLYQESKNHKSLSMLSNQNIAIIDYENLNISILNYKNQSKHVFNSDTIDFLDMDSREGILAMVNENSVGIITNNGSKIIYPEEDYLFLKIGLLSRLSNFFIIILSSSKSNVSNSKVEMFQLCNM